ncbi:MAG: Wzz/FepE/Etk N-terminal domain-containing protein [candidate division WOR-3 bacterium]|nr:Wzz/FepE/Etk N-terminal domain-containing protein [candidate division WOR-3 bacterium]
MNRLVKYLSVIIKWHRLIFWNTLVFTALAVVVSFILSPRYTATAQLLPPSDDGDIFGITSLLGGGASSGLSKLKAGLTGSSTGSDLTIGILNSRTVMQHVAERCSIASHYRIRKPTPEKLVRQLGDMAKFAASDEGIVKITVEANSRLLAAQLANAFVAELDSFLRYSNISRGHNMRVFIEKRLGQLDTSLAVASESLKAFQEVNKVASVDDETKASIDAYAKMQSELSVKEAEYEAARSGASDENPYVDNLRREIEASRDELRKLEQGGGADGFGVGYGVSFARLPGVAAQFARRYQDFKIQEESYATLYQQYEYARVLEARDAPALTVLDYAVPPERRSFPRRTVIVGAVLLFSLIAGIGFAFVAEYFAVIKTTRPEEYQGWRGVADELVSLVRGGRLASARKR